MPLPKGGELANAHGGAPVTVGEAISAVREVGTIEAVGETIKLRIPPASKSELNVAIEVLRREKVTALKELAGDEPTQAEINQASDVLGRAGVRLMVLNGIATIGLWPNLDGPEVRAALRFFKAHDWPVRWLNEAGIPMHYKKRWLDSTSQQSVEEAKGNPKSTK